MTKSHRIGLFLLLVMIFAPGFFVHSYSFSTYTGMIGEGVLSIAPTATITITPDFSVNGELIATCGILPSIDLTADFAAADLYPEAGYLYLWIMPRFEVAPGHILGLQANLSYDTLNAAGSFSLSPQYHLFIENDVFALELNVLANIPLLDPAATSFSAFIAPVWKPLGDDLLALYLEIDPTYILGDPGLFVLNIIPGICVTIPDTPHRISAGVIIGDVTSQAITVSAGIWYAFTISLIPENGEEDPDS